MTTTLTRNATADERRPLIYVAAFYSANPAHGIYAASRHFDPLTAAGWTVVVPHVSFLLDALCPHDPQFWYAYDKDILARCDAMFLDKTLLSKRSVGVLDERDFCAKLSIPVIESYLSPKEVLA